VSGDTVLVGSAGDDDVPFSSGSTYVYVRDGADWVQQAKLVASDAADQDYFGGEVVVSGDTALITARGDDDDGLGSGSVYVFLRSNGSWHELTKLTASDATTYHEFGWAVSISGRTALIGAYADDIIGNASGSAYVFLLDGIGSLPCTIVGTGGNDVLTGTPGSDVICARGGNDIIYGNGGDDVLRGGAGADRIFGGFGFDWISGNAGNDVLVGGAQGDTMIGGPGRDVLRGKAGDDHLEGNKGNDSLVGAKGDDNLFGGAGTDSCSGGLGDNTLKGCE
jgi:Ca2+-binding RTX toxin-like protein